jgi:hypothetical protein
VEGDIAVLEAEIYWGEPSGFQGVELHGDFPSLSTTVIVSFISFRPAMRLEKKGEWIHLRQRSRKKHSICFRAERRAPDTGRETEIGDRYISDDATDNVGSFGSAGTSWVACSGTEDSMSKHSTLEITSAISSLL